MKKDRTKFETQASWFQGSNPCPSPTGQRTGMGGFFNRTGPDGSTRKRGIRGCPFNGYGEVLAYKWFFTPDFASSPKLGNYRTLPRVELSKWVAGIFVGGFTACGPCISVPTHGTLPQTAALVASHSAAPLAALQYQHKSQGCTTPRRMATGARKAHMGIVLDMRIARAETAEAHGKTLEQTVLERGHEVKSLTVRPEHAEDALEKSEAASVKLRDLDVKPEEAERNLHVAEKERNQWKQKYERTTRQPKRSTHRKGGTRRTCFTDGGPCRLQSFRYISPVTAFAES
ncbi:hypothetical protein DFH08DRAFT_824626 [Mycena albidolilacea]|uniref:Uncharacterized protein n=1 Tax=Mycena albidolilacea TaxID=1033008 RepID=A0AAD7EA73_9AGAR|nr:hypothetical protein DFH08DRAFT_824626 [Mycena albidolilacea]